LESYRHNVLGFAKVCSPSLLFTCICSEILTFLQNLWVRSEGFEANTARGKNDSEPPLRLSNLHRQKICCVSGTQDEFVIECSFWFGAMLVG